MKKYDNLFKKDFNKINIFKKFFQQIFFWK